MRTDEPSTLNARTATKADLHGLAASLTRAFEDDPVWRWLVPDDRRWVRSVPYVFRHAAREQIPHQSVWVTPDHGAAAIWAGPGHRPSPVRELLVAPKMATVFRRRSLAGMRLEAAMRAGRPTEPHWYLAVLGTDPDFQGRGYGSEVLRPVLEQCDETATGAYLESSKETNIPYYRRHGFEVIGELQPVDAIPPLYRMWRDPRPVVAATRDPD
jgi:ribosomal protein S18 acetylase RimI-like enzyme